MVYGIGMSNNLRAYLSTRRKELIEMIEPRRNELTKLRAELVELESELQELDQAAQAIGMVNGVQKGQSQQKNSSAVRGGTIKDFVVQVLSDYQGGLVALDILAEINDRFGTNYPRTSLSPQLSPDYS